MSFDNTEIIFTQKIPSLDMRNDEIMEKIVHRIPYNLWSEYDACFEHGRNYYSDNRKFTKIGNTDEHIYVLETRTIKVFQLVSERAV